MPPPKIFAPKNVKQIGAMTSAERGVNVTVIAGINAVGNAIPPLFVFPHIHFKHHMLNRAPPGSVVAVNPSGWSNEIIFEQYISHVRPSKESPVLITMDSAESHFYFST